MILERIHSRADLLDLTEAEQGQLCREIRDFLIRHVSQTGGHLASNLGVVELTLAIERVFDTEKDRLVFDVGHQSYVHKLLTGRADGFDTLRQFGGMSGFPSPEESMTDAFIAGHASNAVSVALGMARARTLQKQDYSVLALVGDGALTGGLAYEGLNNAGASREPLIVILNDNGMSITPNVGAISRHLARVRLQPGYLGFKLRYRAFTAKIPGGKKLYDFTHKLKERLRRSVLGANLFDSLGFTYLGPVDGHDLQKVEELLKIAKALHEPVLLHLITKKGKGYTLAENMPAAYHGVGKFDPALGASRKHTPCFSDVFGQTLTELAAENPKLCAITAAMRDGTGLTGFAKTYPSRFFDVGIAEEHAVSMACGMAKQGLVPAAAIYSTFLQRSFDMLLHDLALLQLHVVLGVDRAGLVGEDGRTHHGMFDVGYLRQVPGMKIYCPASFAELSAMLRQAVLDDTGPVAVRYPRGGEGAYRENAQNTLLLPGTSCTVITYGTMINAVLGAVKIAEKDGISVEILKLRTIAPVDWDAIEASCKKTGRVFVAEETSNRGCLADEIFAHLAQVGISCVFRKQNLGDDFVTHGAMQDLYKLTGLDAAALADNIREVCHEA